MQQAVRSLVSAVLRIKPGLIVFLEAFCKDAWRAFRIKKAGFIIRGEIRGILIIGPRQQLAIAEFRLSPAYENRTLAPR